MADKELIVAYRIDNRQALDANQKVAIEMAKLAARADELAFKKEHAARRAADTMLREERRVAAEMERLNRKGLTDEQVNQAARNRIIDRANDHRIKAAVKAADEESGHLQKGTGLAGAFAGALQNTALQFVGIGAAAGVLRGVADAFGAVRQNAIEAGKSALTARDALRELAALRGKGAPTAEEVLELGVFRRATGLTEQEAIDFQTQYEGSVNVGIEKKNITPEVAKKFEVAAAQYGARLGGSQKTRGEMAGLLSMFEKVESVEQGLARLEGIRQSLTLGRGEDTPLSQATLDVGGSMVREGGPLPDLQQLAALVGTVSLSTGAGEAATGTKRAVRFLGETQGAGARYLKRAKITEGMSFREKLEKIKEDVQNNAKGRDVSAYLGEQVEGGNTEEIRTIVELLQNYDVLMQRMDAANVTGGGAEVARKNREFLSTDKLGRSKVATAMEETAVVEQGVGAKEETIIETKEARSRLIASERRDSAVAGMIDFVKSAATLGQVGGEDIAAEEEARRALRMQGAAFSGDWMKVAVPGLTPFIEAGQSLFASGEIGAESAKVEERRAEAKAARELEIQERSLKELEKINKAREGTPPVVQKLKGAPANQARL